MEECTDTEDHVEETSTFILRTTKLLFFRFDSVIAWPPYARALSFFLRQQRSIKLLSESVSPFPQVALTVNLIPYKESLRIQEN